MTRPNISGCSTRQARLSRDEEDEPLGAVVFITAKELRDLDLDTDADAFVYGFEDKGLQLEEAANKTAGTDT